MNWTQLNFTPSSLAVGNVLPQEVPEHQKHFGIRCLPQQHFKKVMKIGQPILWSVDDLLHFLCHIWTSALSGLGFLSNVFTNPVESSFSLYVCIISVFHKLNWKLECRSFLKGLFRNLCLETYVKKSCVHKKY